MDVNLKTGKVWGKRFVVGHDCGIVINPQLLNQTIEGNVAQALSRATYEEVMFSKDNVFFQSILFTINDKFSFNLTFI